MAYTNRYNESVAYDLDAYDISDGSGLESTVSYDFDLFDPRTRRVRKGAAGKESRTADRPAQQRVSVEQPKKAEQTYAHVNRKALVKVCMFGALLAAMFIMLIVSQVQSHELTRNIQIRENDITLLEQDYDAMLDKFHTEMSDSAVAEYAAGQFGLQPRDNNQTIYVSLDSGDVFEFEEDNAG